TELGLAPAIQMTGGGAQVARVTIEGLVEQRGLDETARDAAAVDRIRMVGGVADGDEAARHRSVAVDEAAEAMVELPHDEDGRLRSGNRLRGPAGAPGRDGGEGAEEALEVLRLDERPERRVADRRSDGDGEAAGVGGEERDLHPAEIARDERRP